MHTAAIKQDGTLWAWGKNNRWQLGDSTNIDKNVPTQIGNDNAWKEVKAGYEHTIAIKDNGALYTWGSNGYGQSGNGNSSVKPEIVGSTETISNKAVGTNPKIVNVNNEIIIFYLTLNKEIAYRTSRDNYTVEKTIGLPDGYKDSFDVKVQKAEGGGLKAEGKIWLSYADSARNIYYVTGKIEIDSMGINITSENNSNTTIYARAEKEAIKEAEEMYINSKNKGLEIVNGGIKLASGYEAGWIDPRF